MRDTDGDADKPTKVEESKVIGIDLGIKDFLTDSFNRTVDNPKELKRALKELKKAHREVSRKVKGSRRRSKAVGRLAKIYRKVARKREDFQHKVSKRLIDESQAVIAESLKNQEHDAQSQARSGNSRCRLGRFFVQAQVQGGKKRKALHTNGHLFSVLEDLPAMSIQV